MGPDEPPERIAACSGSTAQISISGFFSFRTSPIPVIVPPVPMPEQNPSIGQSACSRISTAVRSCGLQGLPDSRTAGVQRLSGLLRHSQRRIQALFNTCPDVSRIMDQNHFSAIMLYKLPSLLADRVGHDNFRLISPHCPTRARPIP